MENRKPAKLQKGDLLPEPALLDCYMELIAYTRYVLRLLEDRPRECEQIAQVYDKLIKRSAQDALDAGFPRDLWREGFFPVCAWVDEVLSCSDWSRSKRWQDHQLQRRYFNTTAAGWQFYQRMEQLPEQDNGLRSVYEFCLALGFKGRYFRTADMGRYEDIQYTQLKKVTDNIELKYPATMFPEAYAAEEAGRDRKSKSGGWKRFSFFGSLAALMPVIIFIALYFAFDRLLDRVVVQCLGVGF